MPRTTRSGRSVVSSHGSEVVVDHLDADHARLQVHTQPDGPGSREGAALVCRALSAVRSHGTRSVEAELDASVPACGVVLEALRHQLGQDLEQIEMRRAGSSVLVTLELRPPLPSGETRDGRPVPAVPFGPSHASAPGRPRTMAFS